MPTLHGSRTLRSGFSTSGTSAIKGLINVRKRTVETRRTRYRLAVELHIACHLCRDVERTTTKERHGAGVTFSNSKLETPSRFSSPTFYLLLSACCLHVQLLPVGGHCSPHACFAFVATAGARGTSTERGLLSQPFCLLIFRHFH